MLYEYDLIVHVIKGLSLSTASLVVSVLLSSGAEAVWVLGAGVAVTALGEAHALDTLGASRAALAGVISAGVTVTAGREGGLALTILGTWHEVTGAQGGLISDHLAHVSAGTEAVWILSAGVAVAA